MLKHLSELAGTDSGALQFAEALKQIKDLTESPTGTSLPWTEPQPSIRCYRSSEMKERRTDLQKQKDTHHAVNHS